MGRALLVLLLYRLTEDRKKFGFIILYFDVDFRAVGIVCDIFCSDDSASVYKSKSGMDDDKFDCVTSGIAFATETP